MPRNATSMFWISYYVMPYTYCSRSCPREMNASDHIDSARRARDKSHMLIAWLGTQTQAITVCVMHFGLCRHVKPLCFAPPPSSRCHAVG